MSGSVATPGRFLLPPPSPLARRLARPGASAVPMPELVWLIELDAGLTVRILRVANSPFYGVSRQIGSVREAMLLLGEQAVRRLALSGAVAAPLTRLGLDPELVAEVWEAGVSAACLGVRLLDEHELAASAFPAGLLQDIGRLELALCPDPNGGGGTCCGARGEDHHAVGAQLLRHWQFPEDLACAVESAEQPDAPVALLSQAIWLANRLLASDPDAVGSPGLAPNLTANCATALAAASREVQALRALLTA